MQALTAAFLQSVNSGAVPKAAVLVVPKKEPTIDVAQARRELQDAAAEDEAFAAIEKAKIKTAPQAATEVTLDDCKREATSLAKRDREALAAILAEMNAGKVSLLKPEQYADFIRRVDETIPF